MFVQGISCFHVYMYGQTSALFALMSSNGSHSTRTIDNVPRILGEANSTCTQIFFQQAIRSDERIIWLAK